MEMSFRGQNRGRGERKMRKWGGNWLILNGRNIYFPVTVKKGGVERSAGQDWPGWMG